MQFNIEKIVLRYWFELAIKKNGITNTGLFTEEILVSFEKVKETEDG